MNLCVLPRCEEQALAEGLCERHQNIGRGEQHDPHDREIEALKATVRDLSKALRDVRFDLLLHDRDAMGRERKWVWELKKRIDSALVDR